MRPLCQVLRRRRGLFSYSNMTVGRVFSSGMNRPRAPSDADAVDCDCGTMNIREDNMFTLRSYQDEILEASLKQNIIVAMDTGSGKTRIALARAAAELERCDPTKLVWFLAPTVTLCRQQYIVFKKSLPAHQIRLLSGDDNADRWSEQKVWDTVLKNIRIVVSTHAVLRDALTHGFVRMSRIALLIFDEAHHCRGKHPGNQIMSDFYYSYLSEDPLDAPAILGLTASPVVKAVAGELEIIERNLNATCRSPKLHRSELLKFAHVPDLIKVSYGSAKLSSRGTLLERLNAVYRSLKVEEDPKFVELVTKFKKGNTGALQELHKLIETRKSYCFETMRLLCCRANEVFLQLGGSCADWYINQCISSYRATTFTAFGHPLSDTSKVERNHILELFNRVTTHVAIDEFAALQFDDISPKVEALIDNLESEAGPSFTGLIFVEQRAIVACLAQLLTTHPRTRELFSVGTFVGTSTSTKVKYTVADLVEPRTQQETLVDVGATEKSLIIATDVLEEGIDISSCYLVICFDPPKNLKSFIQRRGRARMEQSKYLMLIPDNDRMSLNVEKWHALEEAMKEAYLNDERIAQEAEKLESIYENNESSFRVPIPSHGALLTLENAITHLYHFCTVVRSKPSFSFQQAHEVSDGLITAEVSLPVSIHASLRTARSSRSWKTERMARKDAAFQMLIALFQGGLVTDRLLPLVQATEDGPEPEDTKQPLSFCLESPLWNPWRSIAEEVSKHPNLWYRTAIKISHGEREIASVIMLLPCSATLGPPFNLYWGERVTYTVVSEPLDPVILEKQKLDLIRRITRKILVLGYGVGRMQESRYDFPILFLPTGLSAEDDLSNWLEHNDGVLVASQALVLPTDETRNLGFVRKIDNPHVVLGAFQRIDITAANTEISDGVLVESDRPRVEVEPIPRRRNFLMPPPLVLRSTASQLYDATTCTIDKFPANLSLFAVCIPSLLFKYGSRMTADALRRIVLPSVALNDLSLVETAITTRSANGDINYQRLEFLGDVLFKMRISVQLMAAHPAWPEGYLTMEKSRKVSNNFFSKACIEAGIAKFIMGVSSSEARLRRPRYVQDILESSMERRTITSTKLLADVVESLVGASFIDGGMAKLDSCILALFPNEPFLPLEMAQSRLFDAACLLDSPVELSKLEALIGYTFRKKSLLLEALTHPSFPSYGENTVSSYQRLEFLGDAVLDLILSIRLFRHDTELTEESMHNIRIAMVNASFIAFCNMECTLSEERINIKMDANDHPVAQSEIVHTALWQYMRHISPDITARQEGIMARHSEIREGIIYELEHGRNFPWHLLTRPKYDKYYSDLVESVVGAIYIDSRGDLAACENFISKLGILNWLDIVLRTQVDCENPKGKLDKFAPHNVQYVTNLENGIHKCFVKVRGEQVGGVVEATTKQDAEIGASWSALRILTDSDDEEMEDVTKGLEVVFMPAKVSEE